MDPEGSAEATEETEIPSTSLDNPAEDHTGSVNEQETCNPQASTSGTQAIDAKFTELFELADNIPNSLKLDLPQSSTVLSTEDFPILPDDAKTDDNDSMEEGEIVDYTPSTSNSDCLKNPEGPDSNSPAAIKDEEPEVDATNEPGMKLEAMEVDKEEPIDDAPKKEEQVIEKVEESGSQQVVEETEIKSTLLDNPSEVLTVDEPVEHTQPSTSEIREKPKTKPKAAPKAAPIRNTPPSPKQLRTRKPAGKRNGSSGQKTPKKTSKPTRKLDVTKHKTAARLPPKVQKSAISKRNANNSEKRKIIREKANYEFNKPWDIMEYVDGRFEDGSIATMQVALQCQPKTNVMASQTDDTFLAGADFKALTDVAGVNDCIKNMASTALLKRNMYLSGIVRKNRADMKRMSEEHKKVKTFYAATVEKLKQLRKQLEDDKFYIGDYVGFNFRCLGLLQKQVKEKIRVIYEEWENYKEDTQIKLKNLQTKETRALMLWKNERVKLKYEQRRVQDMMDNCNQINAQWSMLIEERDEAIANTVKCMKCHRAEEANQQLRNELRTEKNMHQFYKNKYNEYKSKFLKLETEYVPLRQVYDRVKHELEMHKYEARQYSKENTRIQEENAQLKKELELYKDGQQTAKQKFLTKGDNGELGNTTPSISNLSDGSENKSSSKRQSYEEVREGGSSRPTSRESTQVSTPSSNHPTPSIRDDDMKRPNRPNSVHRIVKETASPQTFLKSQVPDKSKQPSPNPDIPAKSAKRKAPSPKPLNIEQFIEPIEDDDDLLRQQTSRVNSRPEPKPKRRNIDPSKHIEIIDDMDVHSPFTSTGPHPPLNSRGRVDPWEDQRPRPSTFSDSPWDAPPRPGFTAGFARRDTAAAAAQQHAWGMRVPDTQQQNAWGMYHNTAFSSTRGPPPQNSRSPWQTQPPVHPFDRSRPGFQPPRGSF